VITLLEKHPKDRANNACRRARHFGIRSYAGIRDILAQALDFQPLPPTLPFPTSDSATPRFARTAAQLLKGVSNDVH
jgi:hypothetical protein